MRVIPKQALLRGACFAAGLFFLTFPRLTNCALRELQGRLATVSPISLRRLLHRAG